MDTLWRLTKKRGTARVELIFNLCKIIVFILIETFLGASIIKFLNPLLNLYKSPLEIFEVAVDLRQNSETFGQHIELILDSELPQQLILPQGLPMGICPWRLITW